MSRLFHLVQSRNIVTAMFLVLATISALNISPEKIEAGFELDEWPPTIAFPLAIGCNGGPNEAAQTTWITPRNSTVDIDPINVVPGTTSVRLQLNYGNYICTPFDPQTTQRVATYYTVLAGSLPPQITWNSSTTTGLPWATLPFNTDPAKRFSRTEGLFTYNFPGGITSSTTISFTIRDKKINLRRNGTFECVTNPGDVNPRTPTSGSDVGACASIGAATYTVRINVISSFRHRANILATNTSGNALTNVHSSGCYIVAPGSQFRLYSRVRNTGTTLSQAYYHRISTVNAAGGHTVVNNGNINRTGNSSGGAPQAGVDSVLWDPADNPALPPNGSGPNRFVQFALAGGTPAGTRIYFEAAFNPTSPTVTTGYSNQVCIIAQNPPPPQLFDYRPTRPVAYAAPGWNGEGRAPTAGRFYAGTNLEMNGNVRNVSSSTGRGPNFSERYRFSGGRVFRIGGGTATRTGSGLVGGQTASPSFDTRPTGSYASNTFRLRGNTPHGETTDCYNEVTPQSGEIGNSSTWSSGWSRGPNNEGLNTNCITSYNQRYYMYEPYDGRSGSRPGAVNFNAPVPGESSNISVETCNGDFGGVGFFGIAEGPTAPANGGQIRTRIAPAGVFTGATVINESISLDPDDGCDTWNVTFNVPTTANVGDQACVDVWINHDNGFSDGYAPWYNGGWEIQERICREIADQSFVTVDFGSVWAGGEYAGGDGYGWGYCDVPGGPSNGYIRGTRVNSGGAGLSLGAYARYIVGATDIVERFGSSGSPGTVDDTYLTLSNEVGEGYFGNRGMCLTNLYNYLSKSGPGIRNGSPINGSDGGQFHFTGNTLNLNGLTITEGTQITIIAEGNVVIRDNITYDNYNANGKGEIPSFVLVARGDIRISGNVTELDGWYQAGSGTSPVGNGEIDTCYDGPARLTVNDCTQELIVRGAFSAIDIQFRRTYGSVNPYGTRPKEPAEHFVFSPEMYLAEHRLISNFSRNLNIERSIDLPPVVE